MNRKFEVGKNYSCTDLYAGTVNNKCIRRTETTVTFIESDMFSRMDNVTRKPSTHKIRHDSRGNEECLVYHCDHYDFDCVIRADVPDGHNSLDMLEEQENKQEDEMVECNDDEENYYPSVTNGDYSSSNPYNAPGMSINDFI